MVIALITFLSLIMFSLSHILSHSVTLLPLSGFIVAPCIYVAEFILISCPCSLILFQLLTMYTYSRNMFYYLHLNNFSLIYFSVTFYLHLFQYTFFTFFIYFLDFFSFTLFYFFISFFLHFYMFYLLFVHVFIYFFYIFHLFNFAFFNLFYFKSFSYNLFYIFHLL